MGFYLGLASYVNNLRRHGFTEADLADGGSDRLVDALVAWARRSRSRESCVRIWQRVPITW